MISRSTDQVFRFDFKHTELGWVKVTSMLYCRGFSEVLALQGKIYVFEGSDVCFGEVYDVSGNIWVPMCAPSIAECSEISHPVLPDSSRSRILVHFRADRSLYAYYYNDNSWAYDVLDKKWLPVKLLTEFSSHPPVGAPLIHLGNDKWCMVWHSYTLNCFEHVKFRMWNNGHGEIYAAVDGGHGTSASFRSADHEILMP
ncbi:hypothetical protein J1N35_035771 [Gossypium stocksii]|uniref:Uncharacterized protein n=1 Tax=Gossypium stocksii TaxID=47602 RepID=A0A9D3UUL1_9ROSI|nr:hypothetical protein J1N35_035771 [Gossypium stocksii]